MQVFQITAILLILAASFGYLNVRFLKLTNTIGMMVISIIFTLAIFLSSWIDPTLLKTTKAFVSGIDFEAVVLDFMLSFLLFAGALHTNFEQLKNLRWPIILFATVGVLTSTFLVGIASYGLLLALGFEVKLIACFLFGALISPTDPIAVLGILKKAGVPKQLETKIVGESLFNDGVGVVVFLTIIGLASSSSMTADEGMLLQVASLFGKEIIGGLLWGMLIGFATYKLLKSIDDYETEILLTLACVIGGYWVAASLHISAPLALVVAGLFVGNDRSRKSALSEETEIYVDKFWHLLDNILNAVLFVLIGLELLIIDLSMESILIGCVMIIVVLLARYASLFMPVKLFAEKLDFVPHTAKIMTWGGLRGGISIALALSIPEEMDRELFLTITYVIVVFSIVVQGLTIDKVVKYFSFNAASKERRRSHKEAGKNK